MLLPERNWLVVTALYLGWSFMSNDWQITWVVWPIAAILSVIITVICNMFIDNGQEVG